MGKEKYTEIGRFSIRKLYDVNKLNCKLPQEMDRKDVNGLKLLLNGDLLEKGCCCLLGYHVM
jgi:hypothetical protein